jgi:uncharacterized protein YbjQ (UPF0145 family)
MYIAEGFLGGMGSHRMKPSTDSVVDPYKPPTDLLVVTTPFVSGYRVTRVIGATFGLIVRSRGLGQNIFAYFRAWGGGEIKVYTSLLEQVRHQALQRLADHARSLGANAVVSVGFDTSEMGGSMTEVLAYGTAVVVEPDTSPAQPVALH